VEVDPAPVSTPAFAKVVARESVVVASEFVVVAAIVVVAVVVVAVVVVVSVVVVVAAGVVDEHGDDGQEDGDEDEGEEDVVHDPKVRGNGKADDELGHLQVEVEDLPKIGSSALEVSSAKQVEVKHKRRSKSMFVFGLKEISA